MEKLDRKYEILKKLMIFTKIIENFIIINQSYPKYPPIFIIGPARTGTTVIYQCLSYSFKVSYFSNIHSFFSKSPVTVSLITSLFNRCNPPKLFQSKYGKTKGIFSQSQGYQIWRRWFPKRGGKTKKVNLSEKQKKQIYGTISAFEKIYRFPFVNKWQGLCLNLNRISDVFPNALYIRVKRNYLQTAQSILIGRIEIFNNPNKSFTRVTESYDNYKNMDYINQVCGYLFSIEEKIDDDCKKIGNEKFFNITYEEFCKNPNNFIKNFKKWYKEKTNINLKTRNITPNYFKCSKSQKLNDQDFNDLKICIRKYFDNEKKD